MSLSKLWYFTMGWMRKLGICHSGREKLLCPHVDLLHHLHATFAWTFRLTALIQSQWHSWMVHLSMLLRSFKNGKNRNPSARSASLSLVEWEKSLESKLVTCSFSCRNRTLLQIYSNRVDDTESVVSVMQILPELKLYVRICEIMKMIDFCRRWCW